MQEKEENIIQLKEEALALECVTVVRKKNQKYKRKILGNKTVSKTLTVGFTFNDLGNEIGFISRIRKNPSYLDTFNLSTVKNTCSSIKFRLNFYSLKQGIPDENPLDVMIIVDTEIESGRVSFDLKPYDIFMDYDFSVAIEWIKDLGIGELLFSAGFFYSNLFARATSQGA